MRAVAAAVLLFVLNIIGLGLGPFAVGFFTDPAIRPLRRRKPYATRSPSAPLVELWAAYHYWVAGKHLAGDLAYRPG